MHDIVIRHGDVVDGTGAGPARADVAIDGDRITAVGVVSDGPSDTLSVLRRSYLKSLWPNDAPASTLHPRASAR